MVSDAEADLAKEEGNQVETYDNDERTVEKSNKVADENNTAADAPKPGDEMDGTPQAG